MTRELERQLEQVRQELRLLQSGTVRQAKDVRVDPAGAISDISNCFCGDCLAGGAIDDCGSCPRGAARIWSFDSPLIVDPATSDTILASISSLQLVHDAGCVWESDSLSACDGNDAYTYTLTVGGRNPGDVTLVLARTSGTTCIDVSFTYKNAFGFRCVCQNLMELDHDSIVGADPDSLPCTICLAPQYSTCSTSLPNCSAGNWSLTIDGTTYRTRTGPVAGALFDGPLCAWGSAVEDSGLGLFVYAGRRLTIGAEDMFVNVELLQDAHVPPPNTIGLNGIMPDYNVNPIQAAWFRDVEPENLGCQTDNISLVNGDPGTWPALISLVEIA